MLAVLNVGDTLTAVMSGAANAVNPVYVALWMQSSQGEPNQPTGSLNGTSAVTLVSGTFPRTSVESVHLYNADDAAVTITITKIVSGTSYALAKVILQPGDTARIDASGVSAADSSGQSRAAAVPASLAGVTAGTAAASKAVVLDADKAISTITTATVTTTNTNTLNIGANGAGGVAGALNIRDGADPGATVEIASTDLAKVAGVTAGTAAASKAVVLNASADVSGVRNFGITGTLSQSGGNATGVVVQRFGDTATEGLEIRVIDEVVDLADATAVFVNLTAEIPSGALVLSVQANIDVLVVAAGNSTRVGIGPSGSVIKYGVTADKTLNQKTDAIADWSTVLGAAEQIRVNAVQADGSTAGTGDISAGSFRVRIVYAVANSLDDAA